MPGPSPAMISETSRKVGSLEAADGVDDWSAIRMEADHAEGVATGTGVQDTAIATLARAHAEAAGAGTVFTS